MSCRGKIPLFLFLLIFLLSLAAVAGCGEEKQGAIDPAKMADYDKPGTVYIETVWSGVISTPTIELNEDRLVTFLTPLARAGQTEDELIDAAIKEFLANPQLYLIPGAQSSSVPVETGGSGSGFIVTPDGYVVTNAHVVKMTDAELKSNLGRAGLNQQIEDFIIGFEDALGVTLADDQVSRLSQAIATAIGPFVTVLQSSAQTSVFTGVSLGGVATVQKGMAAELTKVGETTPGKDVAIIKINADNLPTVRLADDKSVKDGERVAALGFPGAATFNPALAPTDENVKPSLTQGSLSGRKTMPGGWEVLQTDTAITHGNSGGPLFNSRGDVIGVTTFGSFNLGQQGSEVQGFNFAVPITVVNQFMNETNVVPSESSLTRTYREGVDLFYEDHFSAARDKFKEVLDANPSYPYVQELIASSTAKINEGLDKSTFPIPGWLLYLIPLLLAIGAALAILFAVVLPKRKPGARATVPQAPQSTDATASATAPGPAATVTPLRPRVQPQQQQAAEPPTTEMAPSEPPAPEPQPEAKAEETQGTAATGDEGEGEEPKFCINCGHPVTPEEKFCPNCGHEIKRVA